MFVKLDVFLIWIFFCNIIVNKNDNIKFFFKFLDVGENKREEEIKNKVFYVNFLFQGEKIFVSSENRKSFRFNK